jgi:hypothetical protein
VHLLSLFYKENLGHILRGCFVPGHRLPRHSAARHRPRRLFCLPRKKLFRGGGACGEAACVGNQAAPKFLHNDVAVEFQTPFLVVIYSLCVVVLYLIDNRRFIHA